MEITKYGRIFPFRDFMKKFDSVYQSYENIPVITLIAMQEKNPFKILISTILSARTKDTATLNASLNLFKTAGDAETLANLPVSEISELIKQVGFHKKKSEMIKKTAKILVEKYDGKVPKKLDELLSLPGVGRKTANLVLGEAFKIKAICVDTHVHRISNRLGILKTKTPLETEEGLKQILPKKYWIKYNTYLVAHGQTICKPISPICTKCQVSVYCKRKNVLRNR